VECGSDRLSCELQWWWSRRKLLQVVVASRVAAGGGIALLQVGHRGGRAEVFVGLVGCCRCGVAVVRCGGRVGMFVGLVGCCCSSYKVRVGWCEIRVGKGRDY